MSAITATHTPTTTTPKRSFRRRYSVARGNAYQAWGVFSGSTLLALATQLRNGPVSTACRSASNNAGRCAPKNVGRLGFVEADTRASGEEPRRGDDPVARVRAL